MAVPETLGVGGFVSDEVQIAAMEQQFNEEDAAAQVVAFHGLTAAYKKSERSNGNGGNNCVEARLFAEMDEGAETLVQVRDSKDQEGPTLKFKPRAWTGFITHLQQHGSID